MDEPAIDLGARPEGLSRNTSRKDQKSFCACFFPHPAGFSVAAVKNNSLSGGVP